MEHAGPTLYDNAGTEISASTKTCRQATARTTREAPQSVVDEEHDRRAAHQPVAGLEACQRYGPGQVLIAQHVPCLLLSPLLVLPAAVTDESVRFIQGRRRQHVEAQHDQLGSLAATEHHTTLEAATTSHIQSEMLHG